VRITRACLPRELRASVAAAALAAVVGCGGAARNESPPEPDAGPRPAPPVRLTGAVRAVIELPGVTGLSDLTTDDAGNLWAVAERNRVLVRMNADGSAPQAIRLEGVPPGLDVEGITWLGNDRFALATESDDPRRTSDLMLFARLVDAGARILVERKVVLDYGIWPLSPLGNQGIEGLCVAGDSIVASIESAVGGPASRFAPVAVHDLEGGGWTPYLVRLTTVTGKLSAVSCRLRGDAIDVMAVERHFAVAHLIRFQLPAHRDRAGPRPPPPQIEPVLVADLAALLEHQENFEGLVWDGERAIALIVDNDWATVTGPNLLVRARLSGPAPASQAAPPSASPAARPRR